VVTGLSQPEHRGYSSLTLFLSLATFLITYLARYDTLDEALAKASLSTADEEPQV